MKILRKAIGRVRLFFGFCPKCNSDAPEVDHCKVCEGYSVGVLGYTFPPLPATRERWWRRFIQAETK